MTMHSADAVCFGRPGGETCGPAPSRPVDLIHLARQTLGNRELEQEVLDLFVQQALDVKDRILNADAAERIRLAHGLKGSASGVGAFQIAECAGQIEASPEGDEMPRRLAGLIDEVRDFIAAISR